MLTCFLLVLNTANEAFRFLETLAVALDQETCPHHCSKVQCLQSIDDSAAMHLQPSGVITHNQFRREEPCGISTLNMNRPLTNRLLHETASVKTHFPSIPSDVGNSRATPILCQADVIVATFFIFSPWSLL